MQIWGVVMMRDGGGGGGGVGGREGGGDGGGAGGWEVSVDVFSQRKRKHPSLRGEAVRSRLLSDCHDLQRENSGSKPASPSGPKPL